jgi:hypothetical protein
MANSSWYPNAIVPGIWETKTERISLIKNDFKKTVASVESVAFFPLKCYYITSRVGQIVSRVGIAKFSSK